MVADRQNSAYCSLRRAGLCFVAGGPASLIGDNVDRGDGCSEQSPVHEIVSTLWAALHGLAAEVPTTEVERWAFAIHAALSAPGREYHNHDHVIELATRGGSARGDRRALSRLGLHPGRSGAPAVDGRRARDRARGRGPGLARAARGRRARGHRRRADDVRPQGRRYRDPDDRAQRARVRAGRIDPPRPVLDRAQRILGRGVHRADDPVSGSTR